MAIDASIYSQIRQPEPVNLMAIAGQAQQLQGMQQQNRLADLAFQDRERQQQRQQRLQGIYGQGLQGEGLENALLKEGFANESLKFGTDRRANAKSDADTRAQQIDTAQKQIALAGKAFGFVKDNPTPENALSAVAQLEQYGVWGAEQAARARNAIQQNPGAIAQLALQEYQSALDAKDQLMKISTENLGGQTVTQGVSPVTGQVTQLGSLRNTISPDAQLQATTSMSNAQTAASAQREIAQATRDAASISKRGGNETDLRKEFASLPEVKKFKDAIPAYQAIVKASQSNNPQADINLIYGLAKLYDPDSVVREGEYGTIANSQAIPERIKSLAQWLAGGGRLTDETKKQIREQAEIRIGAYRSEVDGARQGYEEIARRNGLTPENVFVPIGQQVGAPSPAPASGGAVRRYNPATGKIE